MKEWRFKLSWVLAWYDLWVGFYWDRIDRTLYFLPIPCIGIKIKFYRKAYAPAGFGPLPPVHPNCKCAPTPVITEPEPCRCNCGYTCGGPGVCEVFKEDPFKCIAIHYKKDREHDFTGPWVTFTNGGSVSCKKCGMTACDHDIIVGP